MTIVRIILIVLLLFVLIVLGICAYYGGFNDVNFEVEELGGEILVYENVVGDYSQTAAVSDRIYHSLLNDEKITATKSFGIYYNNPKKTAKNQLHSEVGCIIDNADSITLATLSEKYDVKILPYCKYVVSTFPFKGKLSTLLGIKKVYPALHKYSKKYYLQPSPVMEIYDIPRKVIIYRKKIEDN